MLTQELRPQGSAVFVQYGVPVVVAGIAVFVGWGKDSDLTLFSGLAVAGCVIWIWLLSRCKAILTSGRLEYCNGFTTRAVDKRDVAGYRVEEGRHSSRVVFTLKATGAKDIAFPLWIKNHPDAARWFADLTDLDAVDAANARATLESDDAFGPDPESRLARAKFLTKLVAGLGFAAIGFMFAYSFDVARFWLMLAMMVLPLLAVGLEYYYPGQLRFAGGKGKTDPRPILFQALVFPTFLLVLTATIDLHLLDLQSALVWSAPVAAMITFYIATRAPDLRASPWILAVAVGAYAYSFGALAHGDVLFDRGRLREYPVTIVDLHENHGKHTSYHVVVGPWVRNPGTTDFTVRYNFYAELAKGQTLCIGLGQGAFGWPWYDLETCPDSLAPQT